MSTETQARAHGRPSRTEPLEKVVIRFAGDSGDGMQLTGGLFTSTSALAGNDLATLPDFPAEIRAPAGSLAGVSGFQIQFSSIDIFTPGDAADVLVAMNPAALKANLAELRPGGILIVNTGTFRETDLRKAGYAADPLEEGSLDRFRVFKVDLTDLTRKALAGTGLDQKQIDRCKNFFALGMTYWLYQRSPEMTLRWIEEKFGKRPQLAEANRLALKAGLAYCEATEVFQVRYEVAPAALAPGKYRNISGNSALALGMVTAARKAGIPLFLGSYPITPASDILHELSGHKRHGVYTFQAEDEIAAIGAAIGASFGGALGFTCTSGPGVALKTEMLGLATMVELPLVVANIQRGGPSTGLPTKNEQGDLMQALFGRNSEAPIPVLAASSPADCFLTAYEAARIAIKYMTPVILLSDGTLGNGAEPWRIPDPDELPGIPVRFRTEAEGFAPYLRDASTLARPWATPGTPGLEHRIGGLEKEDVTGNVSYDPLNHEKMVRLRAEKVARIVNDIPDVEVHGPETGKLVVVGWGSTFGSIRAAVSEAIAEGRRVSHVHLRHLNPLPRNLGHVLSRFDRVLVPEMNLGQLLFILRAKYLVDARGLHKVQGRPFKESEILAAIDDIMEQD